MEFSFFQYLSALGVGALLTGNCGTRQIKIVNADGLEDVENLLLSLDAYVLHLEDSSKLVISMAGIDVIFQNSAKQLLLAISEVPACCKIIDCKAAVLEAISTAATVLLRGVWLQAEGESIPELFGEQPIAGEEVLACLGRFTSLRPTEIAAGCGIGPKVVDKVLAKLHRDRIIRSHPVLDGEVLYSLPFGGRVAAYV